METYVHKNIFMQWSWPAFGPYVRERWHKFNPSILCYIGGEICISFWLNFIFVGFFALVTVYFEVDFRLKFLFFGFSVCGYFFHFFLIRVFISRRTVCERFSFWSSYVCMCAVISLLSHCDILICVFFFCQARWMEKILF